MCIRDRFGARWSADPNWKNNRSVNKKLLSSMRFEESSFLIPILLLISLIRYSRTDFHAFCEGKPEPGQCPGKRQRRRWRPAETAPVSYTHLRLPLISGLAQRRPAPERRAARRSRKTRIPPGTGKRHRPVSYTHLNFWRTRRCLLFGHDLLIKSDPTNSTTKTLRIISQKTKKVLHILLYLEPFARRLLLC